MSNINKQNIDALLSETRRDREWSQRIVEFSQELVNQDKSLWHEYWIPKLALQRNDLPEPFLKLKSVESLNRAISLVPYAFFDYDLSHQWIDDSDILDSFPPTHPERICILNLSYNNLTAIGLDNIFRSAKFNKISAIYVDFNPIRSAGFEAICHTFLDMSIHTISVLGASIEGTELHWMELLDSGGDVSKLHLGSNRIDAVGAYSLSRSPILRKLTHLNINACYVGDKGLLHVLNSPELGDGLIALNVGLNQIGLEGIQVIQQSERLASLQTLVLDGNNIDDRLIEVICRSSYISNLSFLSLFKNSVGSVGITHLLASDLVGLETNVLDLGFNPVGDDGLHCIASSDKLANVRRLVLNSCSISDRGLSTLADCDNLTQLEFLDLRNNKSTDRGIRNLLKSQFFSHVHVIV